MPEILQAEKSTMGEKIVEGFEIGILLIVSNQKQMKKVWQNVRLRESWVEAFYDAHYDQLVVCGNFFFLDQTQQADEIWSRL
jgi:hypothetical protein